jgi:hypothetical protein
VSFLDISTEPDTTLQPIAHHDYDNTILPDQANDTVNMNLPDHTNDTVNMNLPINSNSSDNSSLPDDFTNNNRPNNPVNSTMDQQIITPHERPRSLVERIQQEEEERTMRRVRRLERYEREHPPIEITPMDNVLDQLIAHVDLAIFDKPVPTMLNTPENSPNNRKKRLNEEPEVEIIQVIEADVELGKFEEMKGPPTPVQDEPMLVATEDTVKETVNLPYDEPADIDELLDGEIVSDPELNILEDDEDEEIDDELNHIQQDMTVRPPCWFTLPDVSTVAPTPHVALGSIYLPRDAIPTNPRHSQSEQLHRVATRRQEGERRQVKGTKIILAEHFRSKYEQNARYCRICSEVEHRDLHPMPTYHKHYSDLQSRLNVELNHNGEYHCGNCRQHRHNYRAGTRFPVLLTSSILAKWRDGKDANGEEYEGDRLHFDSISIPGARFEDLRRAIVAEYGLSEIPLDVLLVAGLNDVSSPATLQECILDLHLLREEVLRIPGSTFTAARLPYPPSLVAYERQRPGPYHINRLNKLSDLNGEIFKLNNLPHQHLPTQYAPNFTTWGSRTTRVDEEEPRQLRQGFVGHRRRAWREARPGDQLHLADHVRRRMGKAVNRFFMAIYGMLEDRGPRPDQARRRQLNVQ